MKRGPFWKFRTILSLRDSFHKLREESQTSLQRPEKWSLGLRSPNSISSWVLIARKGHGWDVVILVSIFLSWLCCCCHWHLLLAERFGFQTSNQRLLISPGRAAFGLPLNSSLTPTVVFSKAWMVGQPEATLSALPITFITVCLTPILHLFFYPCVSGT